MDPLSPLESGKTSEIISKSLLFLSKLLQQTAGDKPEEGEDDVKSSLLSISQNTNHIAIICPFMSVKSKWDVAIGIQRVIALCKNRERVNQLVKKQNKWSNKKKSLCINDGW